MELEGHPTQDIVEELQQRGAHVYPGTQSGPDPASMQIAQRHADAQEDSQEGIWVFLPSRAYETDIDELPS